MSMAGFFFLGVPGISLLHCDLGLANLDGATRTPYGDVQVATALPKIGDAYYVESERFPVRDLAFAPAEPARRLLERLFASFLDDPDRPFADVSSPEA